MKNLLYYTSAGQDHIGANMILFLLNLAAVGSLVTGCGLLFRREYRLVDLAIREKIVSNFSIRHIVYLWLQVKVFSFLHGGKAPPAIFNEYYGRKTFIQANVVFWGTGIGWGICLLFYLGGAIRHGLLDNNYVDDLWFLSASSVLLLVGHLHASHLRHYIIDYRSKAISRLREAEVSLYEFGVSASYEGKIEMPENDNEPVLSREALNQIRTALETPEKSLELLQDLGLVDSDGNIAKPYRSNHSHKN